MCPICFNSHLVDPTSLVCGHTFCGTCIERWHATQRDKSGAGCQSCPLCRTLSLPPEAPARAALPSMPYDRAAAAHASALSRASRLATDYPRTSIRDHLEREHASRSEAHVRRRAFESRLQAYTSSLSSPISGRPLSELERISVHDFNKHFARGAAARSAALASASMAPAEMLRS
ncbi:hypothetical protein KFE25_003356 [Diacronema lutheri]|uniref:RING-type domain-containing protein n=1 Tax=Diacronema lutheri TaxID=2081491 RepID=A0A8J5XHJ8_DIALT|nr:hypothetical protein KFE25_003356 [Diacronema lutheri]